MVYKPEILPAATLSGEDKTQDKTTVVEGYEPVLKPIENSDYHVPERK